MTQLFSGRWALVLVVLCAVLASSGHRSGAIGGAAQGTPATAPAEVGSFDLPEPSVGLANLASYKATLILAFDGTQAGKPIKWTKTYVMLATKEPAARQLTVDKVGETAIHVLMAERDGAAYIRRGGEACIATEIDKDDSPATRMEPAGFLYGVFGAEEASSETVNGVAANHYTFDERALEPMSIPKSTGEMWVAADGGYLVRYVLATKGSGEYFGEDAEGTLTWNYELTNINQPVTVELPNDCPAGMVNAPLLSDAADVLSVPGMLSYSSHTSVADAAAFYQKQLVDLGWKPGPAQPMSDELALLEYTRGVQQLSVIIIAGEGTTTVNIVLESGPQKPSAPTKPPTRTPAPTRTKPPTRTPVPTKTPKP
jgi:hypothetical protein